MRTGEDAGLLLKTEDAHRGGLLGVSGVQDGDRDSSRPAAAAGGLPGGHLLHDDAGKLGLHDEVAEVQALLAQRLRLRASRVRQILLPGRGGATAGASRGELHRGVRHEPPTSHSSTGSQRPPAGQDRVHRPFSRVFAQLQNGLHKQRHHPSRADRRVHQIRGQRGKESVPVYADRDHPRGSFFRFPAPSLRLGAYGKS